jgi:hypothetical protein
MLLFITFFMFPEAIFGLLVSNSIHHFSNKFHFNLLNQNKIRFQLSPIYEPFESDAILKNRVESQIASMQNMTTDQIMEEIRGKGLSTKSLWDRNDLEKYLAINRIHLLLSSSQNKEYERRMRRRRASSILLEMKSIEKMELQSIVDELYSRDVHFNPLSERMVLAFELAQDRLSTRFGDLEYQKTTKGHSGEASSSANMFQQLSEVFSDAFASFSPSKNSSSSSSLLQPPSSSSSSSSSSAAAFPFFGSTPSEKEARRLIAQRLAQREKERERKEVVAEVEAAPLSEPLLAGLVAQALSMGSFDEVSQWARELPRTHLFQLLRLRGEVGTVPKYAPLSTVAAILADSIIIEKNGMGGAPANSDFIRPILPLPSENITYFPPIGQLHISSPSFVSAVAEGGESVAEKRKRIMQKKLLGLTEFAVEKDLLRLVYSRVAKLPLKLVEGISDLSLFFSEQLQEITEFGNNENINQTVRGSDIFEGKFSNSNKISRSSSVSAMLKINRFLLQSINILATWAGGRLLPPSQVLLMTTFYSIVARTGLASFLFSFLIIKLVSSSVSSL